MDIAFTVEKACKFLNASSIQVIGLNAEELGLYFALNRTDAELRDVGLMQFCPRRKNTRGPPPTITGCAVHENKTKWFKPWLPPAQEADESNIRKMLTEAMKNNVYTFDNQIKLQSRGGPIGLELTGLMAQLFMIWWDKSLFFVRYYTMYVAIQNFIQRSTDEVIALNHTAAMLDPEGMKTFVFSHQNSFPNISTRGWGYEIYCLWPKWPPRKLDPLDETSFISHM